MLTWVELFDFLAKAIVTVLAAGITMVIINGTVYTIVQRWKDKK